MKPELMVLMGICFAAGAAATCLLARIGWLSGAQTLAVLGALGTLGGLIAAEAIGGWQGIGYAVTAMFMGAPATAGAGLGIWIGSRLRRAALARGPRP